MKTLKLLACGLALSAPFACLAQYTDVINSNFPGKSMGAYAVGRKVVQLESEFFYEKNQHDRLKNQQSNYGINYLVRYGIWREQLEIVLDGTLMQSQRQQNVPPFLQENAFGFVRNTLGAKYLIYDTSFLDKPNLYSWKANAKFSWRKMIPAISLYVGANFFQKNRFLYEVMNQDFPTVSPKALLSLQSHPMPGVVLVGNLVADNFVSKNAAQWRYVLTLTHNLYSQRWSIFIENEGITSSYYKDSLLRMGATYLFSKELQINASGALSWKTTPTRYMAGLGISYRIYNRHKDIEFREKMEAREKQNAEDAKIFGF